MMYLFLNTMELCFTVFVGQESRVILFSRLAQGASQNCSLHLKDELENSPCPDSLTWLLEATGPDCHLDCPLGQLTTQQVDSIQERAGERGNERERVSEAEPESVT